MKSLRRNRSLYHRASSSTSDSRNDDESINVFLIGSGQQSTRRCSSLLIESIQKLKCGSHSKGVALMSQSEVSIDRPDSTSNSTFFNVPSIDPLTVYPSLNMNSGSTKNCITLIESHNNKSTGTGRRREDDASYDALTAPRRFLSSKIHQKYNSMMNGSDLKVTNSKKYTVNESSVTNDLLPRDCTVQLDLAAAPPHLSDIPECIVIPRMSFGMDQFNNDGVNNDNEDSNEGPPTFQLKQCEDLETGSIKSRTSHDFEIRTEQDNQIKASLFSDEVSPQNLTWRVLSFTHESNKTPIICSRSDSNEWEGKHDYIAESVQPRPYIEYELYDNVNNYVRNDYASACTTISHRDSYPQPSSDVPSYSSKMSQDFSFTISSEGVPSSQRTFYLASPTEETTKMSTLSKKLHSDQRKLSLQASDTSFSTTKSGATQATSHSTSTGISRSSRKTQELIRRFERHSMQIKTTSLA